MAFVLEQALGHRTHTKNLQGALVDDPDIDAHWGLIPFGTSGWARRIPGYRSNWTLRVGLRGRRWLRSLVRRPDAVFFHTQVPALLARRWLRQVPSLISVDATPRQFDELGVAYGHRAGPAWLEGIKWRLNRGSFAAATRIVAMSQWAKTGLVEDYHVPAEKVSVVGPGVDLHRWPYVDRRDRPVGGPLQILFVGADFHRKGGPLLLSAFRELRHLGVELHIVTRQQVPPEPGCVVHHNLQANSPELIGRFAAADIFCLPTDGDASPMVLCEAGATGLACVTTGIAAIPEIVRQGETGLLVPRGDRDALVAALRRLIEDADLRLRLGDAAREHVQRHYDSATNAGRVISLCKSIITA